MELTKEQEQIAYQAFCGAPGWMNGVKAACEAVLALPGDELRKAAQKMADFHSISGTITRAHMTSLKAALATPPVPTDTVRLAPWPEPDADRIEKIAEAMSTVTAPGLPWGKKSAWDREYWIKMARAVEPHVRQILTGPQRDAAVEAALDVFEAQAYNRKDVVRFAEKIVAAVRAADAEKAGAKP
jgi:hypothetical protein